jgi:hypothetical protein
MKKHHTTIVLATLFFTGLIILWWADYTGVDPTPSDAILPALGKVPVDGIRRIEIEDAPADRGQSESRTPRLALERRDEGLWQIVEPIDAAADPSLVETLIRNLKDMRKSKDSGTIHDPPEAFGLARPTVVRVFGADARTPLATLEVGRSIRELLYVRPQGTDGIEVIEPRMLSMLHLKPVGWRDRSLFHLPSFRVGTIAVSGPDRDLKAVRDDGHWRIVRPFTAVADDDKVEGLVAEMSSLQISRGEQGFVADGIRGEAAAKFGLDKPTMTVEIHPAVGSARPQSLVVGKGVPDNPDFAYARVGDQDDVVLIDLKNFLDVGLDPNALRSRKVAELSPDRVEFIQIESPRGKFALSRTAKGWEQLKPTRETADAGSVQRLIKGLVEAETSEFIEPSKVGKPGLDPPNMTIKVWQASPIEKVRTGLDAPPETEPRLVLNVGNLDPLRKMVYARLEGDPSLLAIPEALAGALPQNPLAFRQHTVLSLSPTQITRLKIYREGKSYELAAPTEPGKSTHWRMVAPVDAAADEESITKVVMMLSSLNAEAYVTDQLGDGAAFGFNAPTLIVTWTSPAEATKNTKESTGSITGTLRIGKKVPKTDFWYANIEGSPVVFTLRSAAIEPFEGEFHTHRVLAFPVAAAHRLLLHWPDLSASFKLQEAPAGKGFRWVPESGQDVKKFDLSRLSTLIDTMSKLTAPKFIQYQGTIPEESGLIEPRLKIEVELADGKGKRVLRLGHSTAEATLATNTSGESGPVFYLTGPAWHDLIQAAPRSETLPEDVFIPEAGRASPAPDAETSAKP